MAATHMDSRTEDGENPRSIYPEGEVSIFEVATLQQELLTRLQGGAFVELNLSNVTSLDGAGMQLLFVAHRSGKIRVTGLNPILRERLRALGYPPQGVNEEGMVVGLEE